MISIKTYQDKEFYYIKRYLRENITDEEFMTKHKITYEYLTKIK